MFQLPFQSILENPRVKGLEKVFKGGFFTFQNVAVDLIDHVFGFVADEIGDIVFRDVEGKHDADGVVAEVVEAVVGDVGAVEEVEESLADGVGLDGDVLAVTRREFLAVADEGVGDNWEHTDGTGTCDGLGGLLDELVVLVEDEGLLDGDGVSGEIHEVPREGGDLGAAHTAAGGEDHGELHLGTLGGVDQAFDFGLCGDGDLGLDLLRESGVEDKGWAVDGQNGGEKAVDVADGLGGLGQGLLIDGSLDLILCDGLDAEGDQIGEGVSADLAVAHDGGGAEECVLGLDVLIHGITEGGVPALGGGVQLVRLKVGLELDDLHDELVLILVGEGLELLLAGSIGMGVDLGVPGAAGELLDGWEVGGLLGLFGHGWAPCLFFRSFKC